jgi:hypothetical protein
MRNKFSDRDKKICSAPHGSTLLTDELGDSTVASFHMSSALMDVDWTMRLVRIIIYIMRGIIQQ